MIVSMGPHAKRVLEEALQLPLEERAKVAADLIASVDGAPDLDAESAWAVEIERRARRALSGESRGTDWPAVRKRVEDSLPPR